MNSHAPQCEAYVKSLPWNLRHCNMQVAAEEARDIAAFLSEVVTTPRVDNIDPTDMAYGDWNNGLRQCFFLLIDKLDILAGDYDFPVLTHDNKAPRLCRRYGDEGAGHE